MQTLLHVVSCRPDEGFPQNILNERHDRISRAAKETSSYMVTESSTEESGPSTDFVYGFETYTTTSGWIGLDPHAGIISAFVLNAIKSYLELTKKRVKALRYFLSLC